jgi:dipeptidyl aminopeptidase/acylaminoacyl peptidase
MRHLFALIALLFCNFCLSAQEDLNYQQPSAPIMALADYETPPQVRMDTKKEYMLLLSRNTYKTLDDLNQDEMRLGGLRLNPITCISSVMTYSSNIKVRRINDVDAEPTQVRGLPTNPKIAYLSWSYDDRKAAFTHTTATGVELWVLDIATATATRLTEARLNAAQGAPYAWYTDDSGLLVKMIPADRPALIDPKKELPRGPIVSVAEGKTSQNRTYTDLLKNKTDETNFETLVASELVKVDLKGVKTPVKSKDLYIAHSFSPDGKYLMLTTIKRPFSYIVPLGRFPMTSTVYDAAGAVVKVVNEVPLNEIMAKGFAAVRAGKRGMSWRPDKPATLNYVEALDGGNPATAADHRDELFTWDAPFASAPISLAKTRQRFEFVMWGNDDVAVMRDSWYDTRNQKTYLITPGKPGAEPKIIYDRNEQDIYSDPGNFETRENQYGRFVLAIEDNRLFLIGDGHSAEGQFPFIDAYDLKSGQATRLYRSAFKDKKEDIYSIEDFRKQTALVQIQSKNEYPNFYLRSFGKKGDLKQITKFRNPFESIKDVQKQVLKYKRADGVDLSGTLYMPLDFDKNKKYPLLIWAYPEEFKDKASAGQNSKNANDFTFPYWGSFIYWITKGYVVLDDASFPIIGEGKTEPNDNFVNQLVSNGKAAIDAVDALGCIDRTKVAVGGHSYGAFMTANLLTHCDLFACGIARSGAYNRTLTPFGFQSEQRNYWDVPEVYNTMSPFMNASKMKHPMLMIHGEADNNPGTFTLQTERYFQAIKGLGGKARMVILPKESHGYAAKENILHMLWEQEQFLDKHLK